MLHETYAILAETLSDPTPCLPPGFSGPVSTALGWVKALSLVIGVVALVIAGGAVVLAMNPPFQGDGTPTPTASASSTAKPTASATPSPTAPC